uniref:FERM domain containing kindlin 2 n=1 Tax=Leptobrachium leishanense TaxID=445787 RepID=A0A8C5WMI0_9ANUR
MALDGIRMPDGCYADGTWELNVHITDLSRDVTLRVTGEVHIGGVMLKLVEKLGSASLSLRKIVNYRSSLSPTKLMAKHHGRCNSISCGAGLRLPTPCSYRLLVNLSCF